MPSSWYASQSLTLVTPASASVAQVAVAVRLRLPDHAVQADVAAGGGQLVGDRRRAAAAGRSPGSASTKAEDRRRPAEQRRRRVGLDGAERVRVDVDAARQHEAAGRRRRPGARRVDAADGGDAAVLHQHVGVPAAAGDDDLPPGHHQALRAKPP